MRQISRTCLSNGKLIRLLFVDMDRYEEKGLRKMRQQHAFKVYRIDEFRTSRCCPTCLDSNVQIFEQVPNPRRPGCRQQPKM